MGRRYGHMAKIFFNGEKYAHVKVGKSNGVTKVFVVAGTSDRGDKNNHLLFAKSGKNISVPLNVNKVIGRLLLFGYKQVEIKNFT